MNPETNLNQGKVLIQGMFKSVFKQSADNTLRVTLEYVSFDLPTLLRNDVEVLFDSPVMQELYKQYKEDLSKSPITAHVQALETCHYYLCFVMCASQAGLEVKDLIYSKEVIKNLDVPFRKNLYDVKCSDLERIEKFVDLIFSDCPGTELISFLMFVANHVEYYDNV